MLEQLTATQLAEWEEYSKIEPIGSYKHDFELGYVLSTITNLFISAYGKKGTAHTKPEDFVIEWDTTKKPKQQSVQDMKSAMMALVRSQSGKERSKDFKRSTL